MGVDAEVFTKVCKIFSKRYPGKACGPTLNELVPTLEKLDKIFADLPNVDDSVTVLAESKSVILELEGRCKDTPSPPDAENKR